MSHILTHSDSDTIKKQVSLNYKTDVDTL